jgi:hypothetical protein
MRSSVVRRLILVGAILAFPATGRAQEATVRGTVTDSTGGVLPGVTVRALHVVTGNTFDAVTDERGEYRVAARIGTYSITAQLAGFTTVTRSGLEVQVGQQAVVNLQMTPATVRESVTVTAEAPLIDVSQSKLAANVDSRQLSELPVNGRNWMDLTMLAKGSRANAVADTSSTPFGGTMTYGSFQLNVDGQQVTANCCGPSGQPRFSRDAIAEFEYVSNRFDASQGHSAGVQVNVVTKSGTNTPGGTLSSYFRNDRLIAKDFIQHRVLPYSDQQLSATFGGPIVKDKAHYFGAYEYEREPQTITYNSQYPSFNIDQGSTHTEHKAATRLDYQFSSKTRLSMRWSKWDYFLPIDPAVAGGASLHPSATINAKRYTDQGFATLTQVLSNRALNEIKGGYAGQHWNISPNLKWPGTPALDWRTGVGTRGIGADGFPPAILLSGYQIGPGANYPQEIGQDVYSIRDDFTYSFEKGGQHIFKTGGEYMDYSMWHHWCNVLSGRIVATNGSVPANIQALFPVANDPTTWNLAALSQITRQYQYSVGSCDIHSPRHIIGTWVQDDWKITPRLTLNLGLRYDYGTNQFANDVGIPPFLPSGRPSDKTNFSPRPGFAFTVNDRTVIRGGFGKYYSEIVNLHDVRIDAQQLFPQLLNDGTNPSFAANPFNGPAPSFEQIIATSCPVTPGPSCLRRDFSQYLVGPTETIPYSYQASIGIERQIGLAMGVQADYVFNGLRNDRYQAQSANMNLTYNPATGNNYPFTDLSHRPYPDWGVVPMDIMGGRSNYNGLETSFTKRLSQRWQTQGTYTLSWYSYGTPLPLSGLTQVTFPVAPDLGGEYGLGVGDQRHRATFNGIWQLGHGFQLSGLYLFGSGTRFATTWGPDLRQTGATTGGRWRPDVGTACPCSTIVPLNALVGLPIHRVDLRAQQQLRLFGRTRVDGILEMFNVFNHANYGSYTTQQSNAKYGQPAFNSNVAYTPRLVQLGFRLTF